jgi:glycosyltransferase involved in cell wall biosynthesis
MKPDIVHCHNLHGGYFDLRFLIELSHHVPVVLTLHDAWLLSGHCAHSLTCERWRTGCGRCPDLSIYPSLLRDGTVANWQEKRRIFEQSRLFVVTPSRWLMNKVRQSILKPIESRVIPNGVDLSVFRPGSKAHARQQLNIPEQAEVLLYVGSSDPSDSFKDFGTLKSAFLRLPTMTRRQRWLICLGEKRPAETNDQNAILYHGYEMDESKVALYYQAADVYVHSAKVENFPYAVLEAMACGVPVVASAVGGIPEQIEDGETGFLVPPGDIEALARSLHLLLADDVLRARLSFQAAAKARSLFDLAAQVDTYLAWYLDILQHKDRLC